MEGERFYIYEILGNGNLKKASLYSFKTREEADKSIKQSMHPIDKKNIIAIKAHV